MTVIIWTDNHGADLLDQLKAAYYYSIQEPAILHHDSFQPAQVTHRYEMPISDYNKHQPKLNTIWTRLQFVKSTSVEEARSATHSLESTRFQARPCRTTAATCGSDSTQTRSSEPKSKNSSQQSTTSGAQDADQEATTVQTASVTAASSNAQSTGSKNETIKTPPTRPTRCILPTTEQSQTAHGGAIRANRHNHLTAQPPLLDVSSRRMQTQVHGVLQRPLYSKQVREFLEGALLMFGLIGLIATAIASFHHHDATIGLFAVTSTILLQLQILIISRK